MPKQFGRYRILRQLGQGGMGSVYLAHDTQLDRPVALKVPRFAAEAGSDAFERFRREARLAATLSHPNICPVYDVGQIEGIHYATMAFIDGKPLSDLLSGPRPLPERSVAAVVRKLAQALQEAHAHGVIHRDLKPSNVMINRAPPREGGQGRGLQSGRAHRPDRQRRQEGAAVGDKRQAAVGGGQADRHPLP
jgi:serine/threonine protein kinase